MTDSAALGRFREYPYRVLPDEKVRIWAGYPSIKDKLIQIIESVRGDSIGLYQFTVLHGEFGTGKSHALRFLTNQILDQRPSEYESIAVYLPRIQVEAKTTFLSIYAAALEEGRPQLNVAAGRIRAAIAQEVQARKAGMDPIIAGSPEVDRSISNRLVEDVGGREAPLLKHVLELGTADDERAFAALVGRVRTDEVRVENDFDAVRTFGVLVRLLTQPVLETGVRGAKAFYLFLDEYEVVADFPAALALSVSNGLRDAINAAPEGFCLLLGMTGDAAFMEALVDESLIARMTAEPIELAPLDEDQALQFIREIHASYRDADAKVPPDYPFSEDALIELIRSTTAKTPRMLLRNCRTVFEKAIQSGLFEGGEPIAAEAIPELLI